MDVMTVEDDGADAQISVTAESKLIDLERSRARRYTSEDQKIDYPNDKGLDFMERWSTGQNCRLGALAMGFFKNFVKALSDPVNLCCRGDRSTALF